MRFAYLHILQNIKATVLRFETHYRDCPDMRDSRKITGGVQRNVNSFVQDKKYMDKKNGNLKSVTQQKGNRGDWIGYVVAGLWSTTALYMYVTQRIIMTVPVCYSRGLSNQTRALVFGNRTDEVGNETTNAISGCCVALGRFHSVQAHRTRLFASTLRC